MFKKQEWWKVFLLSVLTGGLYCTYYWYAIYRDVNKMESNSEESHTIHYILYLLLDIFTGSVSGFIFMIIYYKKACAIAETNSVTLRPKSALVYALIMYIPILSFVILVKNHNKLIDAYENGSIIEVEGMVH